MCPTSIDKKCMQLSLSLFCRAWYVVIDRPMYVVVAATIRLIPTLLHEGLIGCQNVLWIGARRNNTRVVHIMHLGTRTHN